MKPQTTMPSPFFAVARMGSRLRATGVAVGPGQERDFIEALTLIGLERGTDVIAAGRSTLARNPDQFSVVDEQVTVLLNELVGGVLLGPVDDMPAHRRDTPSSELSPTADGTGAGSVTVVVDAAVGAEESVGEVHGQYSTEPGLMDRDFALYTAEELEAARQFLRSLTWKPPLRRSRRYRISRHGAIDTRRLLRHSLRRGGEIIEVPRRSHKHKPRGVVVFCDISGSMDPYTRMLLHFLHSFEASSSQIEVFLFGTVLTRVTRELRTTASDQAVTQLAEQVNDWAGGTRIGASLATFNRSWSRRISSRGAVVLIISDGWDRGEPDQVQLEMARLRRLSHRMVWLNPLLASDGYEPLTQGMAAALPFVDDFIPANNLSSLVGLAVLLNQLK